MTTQDNHSQIISIVSEAKDLLLKDPEKALELATTAIERAREYDLKEELGIAYLAAGSSHQQLDNAVEAIIMYKHGLMVAEEIDNLTLQVKLLFALANHYETMNDLDTALQLNLRALDLADQSQEPQLVIRIKDSLVRLFSDLENHEKAFELAQEVHQYWENTDNCEMRTRSLNNLGIIFCRRKEMDKAIEYYRRAIELAREHNYRIGEAYVLNNLGSLYLMDNRFEEAIDFLQQSMDIKKELGKYYYEAGIILNLFEAHTCLEELETAETYLQQAEEMIKKNKHHQMHLAQKKITYFRKKAEVARRSQSHEKAYESYSHMIEEYEIYIRNIIGMYSDNTSRRVAELEVQHEVMKREQEARFHQEQNIVLSRKNEEIQAKQIELQEALDRLSQREEQLTAANAAKDRFFSIIAHDLKTPLNGVICGIDLLKNTSIQSDDPKIDRVTRIVEHSAKNLSTLLQNLLDWARSQRGELKYCPTTFSTIDLIRKIMELFFYSAGAKRIQLDVEQSTDRAVFADPDMVYTILRNLVSNALKFSHPDSKIVIRIEEVDKNLSISVIDQGIGMSGSFLNSLFNIDRNSTRRGTKNEIGTGLGLILSKELALANKGDLKVSSTEGKGSTFTLILPLSDTD